MIRTTRRSGLPVLGARLLHVYTAKMSFKTSRAAVASTDSKIESMLELAPTPLIPIQLDGCMCPIWCKCEFMNPCGSTKDRIATFILVKAWREGVIQRGDVVAEVSSGSTSIAMAMVCAQLGLKFIAFMPEGVSRERIVMIQGFGGQVRFTEKSLGMQGANAACQAFAACTKVFLPRQFQNMDNARAHRQTTASEIARWVKANSPPSIDTIAFTSGVGTGGTMVGLYHGFLDHDFKVLPFAVRPISSGKNILCADCFSSLEQCSFSSRIPGVLDGMSQIYKPNEIEHLRQIEVSDQMAMSTTRALIRQGFPLGPSSGLNVAAALQVAPTLGDNVRLVTILCDRMERYFSTELFTDWSDANQLPHSEGNSVLNSVLNSGAPLGAAYCAILYQMSHSHNSEHVHSKPNQASRKSPSFRHGVRLFILNAILYGACAAFIGAIVGDSLPENAQFKVVLALFVVPFVLAIISTVLHFKSHTWTSVDDMAERLLHPHQTPRQ